MARIAMRRRGVGHVPRRWPALIVLAAAWCGMAQANPFTPAKDNVILERIPEARDAAGAGLRALHTALAADPSNLDLALRTAKADMARARQDGDPRFLGRADAALSHWPIGPATPPEVLLLRAGILQSTHDFAASLAALDQVLRARPGDPQARLMRASVELAQGRVQDAGADCGRYAVAAMGLLADSCVAGVMAASGHAPAALRALTLSLGADTRAPAAARLYAMTIAAETAVALGDASAADLFAQALAVDDHDPYLLAVWSDYLLDHGRAAEVAALLRDRTRIDPLLLRLALAEQALGSTQAAFHIQDLAARFEAARNRGETVHRREEARFRLFLAGDPAGALALARENWRVQREPADARILLQAARAANSPRDAMPVAQWMRATGLQNRQLGQLLSDLPVEAQGHGA